MGCGGGVGDGLSVVGWGLGCDGGVWVVGGLVCGGVGLVSVGGVGVGLCW